MRQQGRAVPGTVGSTLREIRKTHRIKKPPSSVDTSVVYATTFKSGRSDDDCLCTAHAGDVLESEVLPSDLKYGTVRCVNVTNALQVPPGSINERWQADRATWGREEKPGKPTAKVGIEWEKVPRKGRRREHSG